MTQEATESRLIGGVTEGQPTEEQEKLTMRTALGAAFGLNVGQPGEMFAIPTSGRPERLRDELGLLLDTRLYAKRGCKDCYGRGVLRLVKPLPEDAAKQLIEENPANEALMFETKRGGHATREGTMCGCARRRYQLAFTKFGDALVKAGLATRDQATGEYKLS